MSDNMPFIDIYNFSQPVGLWRRRGASDLFISLAVGGDIEKVSSKKTKDIAGNNIWHYWAEGPEPEKNWKKIRSKLKDKLDNDCTLVGEHPLHRLLLKNKKEAAKLWCENASWPEDAKSHQDTYWHCIAWSGSIDLLEQMQDYLNISNINHTDEQGMTPIMIASHRGGEKMVRQMLLLGADPDIQDKQGRTLLHHIAIYGDISWFTQTQDLGARDDIRNDKGQRAEDIVYDKIKHLTALDIEANEFYWKKRYFQKIMF